MKDLLLGVKKQHIFRFQREVLQILYVELFDCHQVVRDAFMRLVDGERYDFSDNFFGEDKFSLKERKEFDIILRYLFLTKASKRIKGETFDDIERLFLTILEYLQNERNRIFCPRMNIPSNLIEVGEKLGHILSEISLDTFRNADKGRLDSLVDVLLMFPELEEYLV